MSKRIVFLSGTRADYGKIKSLIVAMSNCKDFEYHIFVTGMHLIDKYGKTYIEFFKDGFENIFLAKNPKTQKMDLLLSHNIKEFSNFVQKIKPDLIVVHGDRVEALSGALVGALNNIKVAHIEGGELSGTIDDSIRHSISKLSHIHFVANSQAKARLIQLGENEEYIFEIGSPDIDLMLGKNLPSLENVKKYYRINFENYAIFIFHPVTTEILDLEKNIKSILNALKDSMKNYVVIYPNNDMGSEIIIKELKKLIKNPRFIIFPSVKFEKFLTLLKNADFIIGNSSSGIRESCVYGIPSIDIGSRQNDRYLECKNILHTNENSDEILKAISMVENHRIKAFEFGDGKSDERFLEILKQDKIWESKIQKKFVDFV